MGTEYYYGNTETYEYIELGKTSVRNPSLWTDMHYDLIKGEIDTSLIHTYLKENHPIHPTDPEFVEWIANNIIKFTEKAGKNLICKADDLITLPDGEVTLCDEIEPPFWSEGPLIGGIENPWKKVWDIYFKDRENRKNIYER